jgi:hypothetical protein
MPSLYEINREILSCVDADTGEILDVEKLDALNIEKSQKIENVALWRKNLQGELLALEAEEENFAERAAATRKQIERLDKYLADALAGENFSTKKCAVSFRKSERVTFTDIEQIPEQFIKTTTKTDRAPDKLAIKAAIKAGQAVDGCRIVENLNISVK